MKYFIFYVFLFFNFSAYSQKSFVGTVIDDATSEGLPGATVYIPDLKAGAVTGSDGSFVINNLPQTKLLVQVKLLGYASITQLVDINSDAVIFKMQVAAIEQSEVVVTGTASSTDNNRNSVSVTAIDQLSLRSAGKTNFAASLSTVPGVYAISTGGAIAKPVIRGLGFNHVITVNEGVRQEGNQWGDEHGLEIDQFAVDRVEILRGPASLFYGSDALGGVINILEPLSAPEGTIRGELTALYSTNSNLYSNSTMVEGNKGGIPWRMRGTLKSSGPYKTPLETVYNSGFSEKNIEGMIGLNRSWGYSHFHLSGYNATIGIIEAEKDSLGRFIDINKNVVTKDKLQSRLVTTPFQNVGHYKISSVNNFIIKGKQLKVNAGLQQNDRREFVDDLNKPGLHLLLNTVTADVKYIWPDTKGLEKAIGASGMYQFSENKGNEFLIPDYSMKDAGCFIYIKKNYTRLTLNSGVRYDYRLIKGDAIFLDSGGVRSTRGDTLFNSFYKDLGALTGSVGATYSITDFFNLKLNLGRGFRAPNISELSSNGIHEGTSRYEVGNINLKKETSLQADLELSYVIEKFNATIAGFYNTLDNFIYKRNIASESIVVDSSTFPIYRYVQGNSVLYGGEAGFDFHPISSLHVSSNLSLVYGFNNDQNTNLPFIPGHRINNEVQYSFKNKGCYENTFIKSIASTSLRQTHVDEFETPTGAYTIISLVCGTDLKFKKTSISVTFLVENLLNKAYYEHLNRLKYNGVLNPSRNFQLTVSIPFRVK